MNSITKILVTATALVSVGTVNAATFAEAKPMVKIPTSGINLKTAEGQNRLVRLTRAAARKVCFLDKSRELGIAMQERKCFQRALAEAEVQIASLRNPGEQIALRDAR